MMQRGLEASIKLEKDHNINARLLQMASIKPIDEDAIIKASNETKFIVTVEEHNIVGGLGSAVAEVMSSNFNNCKLIRLGIDDLYPRGGSQKYLQDLYGLSIDKIVYKVLKQKEIL